VIKVLWDRQDTAASGTGAGAGPAEVGLTAGEVVDAVAAGQAWAPRTIKTLLNRLVQKNAVEVTVDGRRYLYRARVARDAVVRRESRSFLSRVFGGAVAPAVVHLLEHSDLTPQEIDHLRQILERESGRESRGDRGTRRQGDKGTG
jgi:BlaI family transcriptional regulator, penicillinase repressor